MTATDSSSIVVGNHIELTGYFNPNIGSDNISWLCIIGSHSIVEINENGQRLHQNCDVTIGEAQVPSLQDLSGLRQILFAITVIVSAEPQHPEKKASERRNTMTQFRNMPSTRTTQSRNPEVRPQHE